MHDFCFTIPYGMLLIGGGFMKKGSITSFAGGAGTGFREEEEFLYRCCSPDSYLGCSHTSHGTAVFAHAKGYAGWFGCCDQVKFCALMTCFYVYKIATGGNKIPSKAK